MTQADAAHPAAPAASETGDAVPSPPAGDRLAGPLGRMTLVDGLRAIAALVVILPHATILFRDVADRPGPIGNVVYFAEVQGTLGVQVFFVLSGFVIAYSMRDVRVTGGYFLRFVARRSIRLDPAYWTGIAISCGVLWVGRHAARDPSWTLPTGREVLANVVYLQQFAGCNESVNHTYWTLCQEVQMYLAFCGSVGLLQLARVPYRPVLMVAFVAALGYPLAWQVPWAAWTVHGLFLPYAYAFLAGAAAWWTIAGSVPRWAAMAVAGAALAAAARHNDVPVWAVVVTAAVLAIAGTRGTLRGWLDHRLLQAIGRASYGLYLLHNPVIWLSLMVQRRLGWTGLPMDLLLLVDVCAVSVAAAWAMHVAVERPCLRLARRFRPAGRTDVPLIPS